MKQQYGSWWGGLIQGGQHIAFRALSLIFSGASAWAIYWFFQALGDDTVQHFFTVLTSAGFVVLGYFVTRGLAHRLMHRQRVRSYIPLAFLYIVVEVSCNFAHAAAKYPDVAWVHLLQGWQLAFFSVMLPVVLSIIPLFNIFLAVIDVDLMQEHAGGGGVRSASPSLSFGQPSSRSNGQNRGGYASQSVVPQPSYPSMPVPAAFASSGNGAAGNPLKSWWDDRRRQNAQAAPVSGVAQQSGSGIP